MSSKPTIIECSKCGHDVAKRLVFEETRDQYEILLACDCYSFGGGTGGRFVPEPDRLPDRWKNDE